MPALRFHWEWFGFDIRPVVSILLVALLFWVGHEMMFRSDSVEMGEPEWVGNGSGAQFYITDFSTRFVWWVFGIAQTVMILVILWSYFATIYLTPAASSQQLRGGRKRLALAGLLTFFIFVFFFLLSFLADDLSPRKSTVDGYLLTIARQQCQTGWWLARCVDVSNGLAASVIAAAPLAVGSLLVRPPCGGDNWKAEALNFEAQIRRLRYLLVGSAIMLIVAVAQIYCEFRWATALQTGSIGEAAAMVPPAMAIAAGTAFTLGLLAIFLPAAVILNEWIDKFTKRQHPDFNPTQLERWKKE